MKVHTLLLVTALTLLTACGWQLRNSQIIPQSLGSLHLSSGDSHSNLIAELTRALDVYGVKVVTNANDASYSVVIVDFRSTRRIGTMNASARVAEYQLNEEVDFLIVDAKGNTLIPLSTASVERVYEFNERDVLASDNEEQQVKEGMRADIIYQILNRLRLIPGTADKATGSGNPQ